MNFDDVRRTAIVAMFSDDRLMDQVVLKGGNALAFVYRIGNRSSLDVDFSIDGDFENFNETQERIFRSLRTRFAELGYVVFDESFERRPLIENPDKNWGGYAVEFKLIERNRYEQLGKDLDAIRRNSVVTGPLQRRTFRIDLSKHEFCEGKTERELDDYTIYVYTPEMIAIEKLRAICQQLPEYKQRLHKTARARDFYDIHALITQLGINLGSPENLELTRSIFAAKDVPLELLTCVKGEDVKKYHALDWAAVQAAVAGDSMNFEEYFEFVCKQIELMKSLWEK